MRGIGHLKDLEGRMKWSVLSMGSISLAMVPINFIEVHF